MKALTVLSPNHAAYTEVPTPRATGNMILMKVVRTGICATDFAIYTGESSFVKDGSIKYPVRFGHEWAGIVEAVGEDVRGFKKGDRVYADNAVSCGRCEACKRGDLADCPHIRSVGTVNIWDGCFAEYMLMPDYHVYHLPDAVSFDEGALIEPASIAYDAFRGVSLQADSTVVVTGTGATGFAAVWLAKYFGAGQVLMVGRKDAKLKKAVEVGADGVINNTTTDAVQAVRDLTGGRGADLVIETSGAERALLEGIHQTARYGRISVVSFYEKELNNIPMDYMVLQCLTLAGAAGRFGNPQKICKIMEMYDKKLTPLISHRVSFDKCLDFFEHEEDEIYYILSGRGTLRLDDEVIEAVPNQVIFIPAGCFHALDNSKSDTDMTILTFWRDYRFNDAYEERLQQWGTSFKTIDEG